MDPLGKMILMEKSATYFNNHFGYAPPVKRYHHHDCHVAGTFYSSGFKESLIITMDYSGDGISLQIAIGKDHNIVNIKRFERPQSLGLFYSLITQYCGFTKDSEEYKLMGLAAFGDKHAFDFSWLLSFSNGEYHLNLDYAEIPAPKAPSPHRDEMNYNQKFIEKMGQPKRISNSTISQFYKDVAASAQHQLENIVAPCRALYQINRHKNVCLSGGVALNCLMNQKLMNTECVDQLFVQPASSDAGISMGAALASCEHGTLPIAPKKRIF